jgi:hypothetical protein
VPKDHPVATIGVNDTDLLPTLIDLSQQPHFVLSGQQLSGKTATLRAWVLSMASLYSPQQVAFVLIDSLGFLSSYMGGQHTLADLPHTLDVVTEKADMDRVMKHLQYEYVTLPPDKMNSHEIFVMIDNYDDFKDLRPDLTTLASFTRSSPGRPSLHFVVCGTPIGMRTTDDFLKRVTMTRNALALDSSSVQQPPLNANIPRSLREGELPLGRGFLVKSGKTEMVQIATPYNQDEPIETALDRWVDTIIAQYGATPAQWIPMPGDDAPPPAPAQTAPASNGRSNGTVTAAPATAASSAPASDKPGFTAEQVEALRQQLIQMYEGVGLPSDMVRDLPPSGIIEMAQLRGILEAEKGS